MDLKDLKRDFRKRYGSGKSPKAYRAPGRVNLIGEHTDYNGGLVLPIAVNLSTWALARKNSRDSIRLYSANLDEAGEIELGGKIRKTEGWTDYVRGIISGLDEGDRELLSGLDFYLASEVPVGRGLSSSAALELSVATALSEEFGLGLKGLELIRLCQMAENDFVGANTGIMDQYVSYYGKEETALLIDTSRPSHEYVNLDLSGYEILVLDTTVSHTHGGSEYNQRRAECEEALELLKEADRYRDLESLSRLDPEDLGFVRSALPEKLANRVSHVVEENLRVKRSADYLTEGEIEKAGELFFQSHHSLKEQYEVSCEELDFLVEFARREGVPGARMTGGGFGGASVQVVPEESSEEYLRDSKKEYRKEFGVEPEGFFVFPSDGVKADIAGSG